MHRMKRCVILRVLIRGSVLLFLLSWSSAVAQEFDPVLGYLLAADDTSFGVGGDLGEIRPLDLRQSVEGQIPSVRSISLSGMYSDYYRPGGLEATGASFGRNFRGSGFLSGDSPFRWDVLIRSGQHRWQISHSEKHDNQLVNIYDDHWNTSLKGRVMTGPLVGVLAIRATAHGSYEPLCGLGVDFRQMGAAGIVWKRRHWQPGIDLGWQDEEAHVRLYGRREEYEGWVATPRIGPVHAEVSLKRSNWLQISGEYAEATIEPWGTAVEYRGFLSWRTSQWTTLVGSRGWTSEFMAYGMKGPYPYAKFTAFDVQTDAAFVSVKRQFRTRRGHSIVELERMTWEGYGRGHVEFWPFTSGLVDLLGMRRYFKATTSGHLWRFHMGATRPLTRRWHGQAGINLIDVWPEGELSHWRPAFLLFGKSDEQVHHLDIRRFLGGVVSLSVRYRLPYCNITYSFAQVVPLKMQRMRSVGQKEHSEPTSEKKRESKFYGGGFHRMKVTWTF